MLTATMSSAVPICLACLEAQGVLNFCSVTHRLGRDTATTAIDFHDLCARVAITSMAEGLTEMAAVQLLFALPFAMGNKVVARLARMIHEFLQRCLPARAVGDNVWGERTMSWELILWVARQLTTMDAAIIRSFASIFTSERALKPRLAGVVV